MSITKHIKSTWPLMSVLLTALPFVLLASIPVAMIAHEFYEVHECHQEGGMRNCCGYDPGENVDVYRMTNPRCICMVPKKEKPDEALR